MSERRGRFKPGDEPQGEPEVLRAAREYVRRGWCVVPLKAGSKKPAGGRGWQHARLAEKDLNRHFPPRANQGVGVQTGLASRGLMDVDCDTSEAVAAAPLLLPPTGLVHGRTSKPASHYWYAVEETLPPDPSPHVSGESEMRPLRTAKYQFAEQDGKTPTMIVELRGDGCQTMVPPSIHPEGERLGWERDGEPGRVTLASLRRAVAQVGACGLLARYWPGKGTRNEAALALTGLLVRGGWPAEEAEHFVAAVAQVAGDEEWRQRGASGRLTAEKLAAGDPVTGGPKLATLLRGDGARVVAQVREWLGLRDGGRHGESRRAYHDDQDHHAPGMSTLSILGALTPDDPGAAAEVGTLLSDVEPELVHPLWEGRLYLGKLAILDGDPSWGKTLIALDLAARLTTGRPLPDEPDGTPRREPVGVAYFTAEDDPADTLRPRLDAAGGDPARFLAVTTIPAIGGGRMPTFRELDVIARAIRRVQAQLVVFDPFMSYLDRETNSNRDQDVRAVLTPLAQLAHEMRVAILIIRHLNKTVGMSALYRGAGSIGIIGAVRSALLAARDPAASEDDARGVLAGAKNNLGPTPPSLAYHIDTGADGAPIVVWGGRSPYSANALLAPAPSAAPATPSQGKRAEALLRELLADGALPEAEIQRHVKEAGISEATARRTKQSLGIVSERIGAGDYQDGPYWVWRLPDPPDQPAEMPAASCRAAQGAQDAQDAQDAHRSTLSVLTRDECLDALGPPRHRRSPPPGSSWSGHAPRDILAGRVASTMKGSTSDER